MGLEVLPTITAGERVEIARAQVPALMFTIQVVPRKASPHFYAIEGLSGNALPGLSLVLVHALAQLGPKNCQHDLQLGSCQSHPNPDGTERGR